MRTDQLQYFKPSLPAMLFKEVDGKFSFEFDKDCLLKRIFLIVNMLEYEHVCVFKSFINSGGAGQNIDKDALGRMKMWIVSFKFHGGQARKRE